MTWRRAGSEDWYPYQQLHLCRCHVGAAGFKACRFSQGEREQHESMFEDGRLLCAWCIPNDTIGNACAQEFDLLRFSGRVSNVVADVTVRVSDADSMRVIIACLARRCTKDIDANLVRKSKAAPSNSGNRRVFFDGKMARPLPFPHHSHRFPTAAATRMGGSRSVA
jgi:hypothetical protein